MPKRGHFAATDRGLSVLKQAPPKIDNSFLDQFEKFRQFRMAKVSVPTAKGQAQATAQTLEAATPEERVEDSSKEIEDDLRAELLDRVMKASWAIQRGATLPELKDLLGHASLAMVMRYAHLSPDTCGPPWPAWAQPWTFRANQRRMAPW
jgi:hypothetical protein